MVINAVQANFVWLIQVITIAYHLQMSRFSASPGLSDCIENSKWPYKSEVKMIIRNTLLTSGK